MSQTHNQSLLPLLLLLSAALCVHCLPRTKLLAEEPVPPTFKPHPSIVREGNPREFLGESFFSTGINVVGDGKLLTCHMRKIASRVMGQLDARIDGYPNWHSSAVGELTQYLLDANERVKHLHYTSQTRPPSVVMVRNPVSRVLSAYISKLENRTFDYCSDPTCPEHVDSFDELIHALKFADMHNVNKHFALQLYECGFETGMTYDCIIDYDNRATEWRQCLTKLGLWEEYGSSGWGVSGTKSLFQEDEGLHGGSKPKRNSVTSNPKLFEKYYTPELLEAVFKIYRKDFELLGYSRDVSTYMQPQSEAN